MTPVLRCFIKFSTVPPGGTWSVLTSWHWEAWPSHLFFWSDSFQVTSPNCLPRLLVPPTTFTSSVTTSRTFNLQIKCLIGGQEGGNSSDNQAIRISTTKCLQHLVFLCRPLFYHSICCHPACCSWIVPMLLFFAPAADHDDCRCSPLPYFRQVRLSNLHQFASQLSMCLRLQTTLPQTALFPWHVLLNSCSSCNHPGLLIILNYFVVVFYKF